MMAVRDWTSFTAECISCLDTSLESLFIVHTLLPNIIEDKPTYRRDIIKQVIQVKDLWGCHPHTQIIRVSPLV